MMTDLGTGLCESLSADICLMTKNLNFFSPLQHFVGNLFVIIVEGTRLAMLVIFWHNTFSPEVVFNKRIG